MITFDILTFSEFIKEQAEFFEGARINKIQQPTRREFIFSLRNSGETRQFYVNINPQFCHFCFASKENLEKRLIEIPQKPPMFCMLLRKYIENSRIAKINQPANERILEFYIETYNEVGEKIYLCLAFELMGKHSNVILYNYDTNMIIGCAHNVGAEKSREREIYGGIPYAYPPQQTEQVKSWTSLLDEMKTPQSINSMIDDYYSFFIGEEKFKTLKSQYKTNVSQKLKKLNKALKQMEYKIQSDFDSDKYRLWGDLLLANLYNLKDYSKKVEVYDYENDRNLKIDLNETKTIKENANHFYKLYNKAKTSNEKLSELIDGYREKKSYFEQILYSLDRAEVIEDLMEIMPEIFEGKSQTVKNKKNIEIMKIDLEDGSRIYIGKNNKQNDYIVSKLSSDEDLWFHVHNCAGSHVLLKSQNPTDEMILRCANLAKEYSSAKNSSKVGIIYTKRKFLRKPPASNLGYVTYKNEKEIIL